MEVLWRSFKFKEVSCLQILTLFIFPLYVPNSSTIYPSTQSYQFSSIIISTLPKKRVGTPFWNQGWNDCSWSSESHQIIPSTVAMLGIGYWQMMWAFICNPSIVAPPSVFARTYSEPWYLGQGLVKFGLVKLAGGRPYLIFRHEPSQHGQSG